MLDLGDMTPEAGMLRWDAQVSGSSWCLLHSWPGLIWSRTEDLEDCLKEFNSEACGDCALFGTGLRETHGSDLLAREGWRHRDPPDWSSCQGGGLHPAFA